MKTVKLILCLSFTVLYSLALFAEPVGTLTMEAGTLKLRRNKIDTIYRDPGLSIPVENGDEIQTGFKTRATIEMKGQSETIQLYANTFFTVDGISEEKTDLSMPAGKATFNVEKPKNLKLRKRRRFRLRTANAVIGVKGTRFLVAVLNGNTNLLTLSGIVSLASLAAPEIETNVRGNQAARVVGSAPPTEPVTVPPAVRQKIIESDEAGSFSDAGLTEPDTTGLKEQPAVDDEEATQGVDEIIEETEEQVSEIQEDVSENQSNRRSVEFKIVDE